MKIINHLQIGGLLQWTLMPLKWPKWLFGEEEPKLLKLNKNKDKGFIIYIYIYITHMTPSICIWTLPRHVVRKISAGQKLSIRELYVKQAQILQKLTNNNGHMTTFRNYPISFWLTTMTLTMIIITQMLMSTKNGSKKEMDETKSVQPFKIKK